MPRRKRTEHGKRRVEDGGGEHICTQDVEDAQLEETLAAARVDELRA